MKASNHKRHGLWVSLYWLAFGQPPACQRATTRLWRRRGHGRLTKDGWDHGRRARLNRRSPQRRHDGCWRRCVAALAPAVLEVGGSSAGGAGSRRFQSGGAGGWRLECRGAGVGGSSAAVLESAAESVDAGVAWAAPESAVRAPAVLESAGFELRRYSGRRF